jgi:hypothetical protein
VRLEKRAHNDVGFADSWNLCAREYEDRIEPAKCEGIAHRLSGSEIVFRLEIRSFRSDAGDKPLSGRDRNLSYAGAAVHEGGTELVVDAADRRYDAYSGNDHRFISFCCRTEACSRQQ